MFKLDKKEIHIFDIDGCIFPARNKKGIHIMPTEFESETPTKEIIDRMEGIELLSDFIDFYKLIVNSIKQVKIYFVTGRKRKDYQIITLEQLSVLNTKRDRDNLVFFPNEETLTRRSYYEFKFYHIIKIITDDNGISKVNIYDDRFKYFDKLNERLNDLDMDNVDCHKVKEPEQFWNIRCIEYKSLIKIINNKKRGWKK